MQSFYEKAVCVKQKSPFFYLSKFNFCHSADLRLFGLAGGVVKVQETATAPFISQVSPLSVLSYGFSPATLFAV